MAVKLMTTLQEQHINSGMHAMGQVTDVTFLQIITCIYTGIQVHIGVANYNNQHS